jgi:glutamate racemase
MLTTGASSSPQGDLRLIITDSGLGGLAICAEVERNLRLAGRYRQAELVYFNAWPDDRTGYNDLPDMCVRAAVFDRALDRMAQSRPDRIVIACNTLSVVYEHTAFNRTAQVPVLGIIDAGVELFRESLDADPAGSIVLFGTRTTIESGVHRERLVRAGIDPGRIASVPCHGLATAIERNPGGPRVGDLIEGCAASGVLAGLPGTRLYAGLCCTHYGFVAGWFRSVLERRSRKTVTVLDPNPRLASQLAPLGEARAAEEPGCEVTVQVISKVELDDEKRHGMAGLIEPVSAATARALLSYSRVPDLF